MTEEKIKLSPEQQAVVNDIEKGCNIFVTGGAGTGKTFLLNYLKNKYKKMHITASSDEAAVNVGGVNLNVWAGLQTDQSSLEVAFQRVINSYHKNLRSKLKKAKMLAIDEISMISSSLFDRLNDLLQKVRENEKTFGGIQVIAFGDFLQLPPQEKTPSYCFESKAWREGDFQCHSLVEVFRKDDPSLINLLSNIRFDNIKSGDLKKLKKRVNAKNNSLFIKPVVIKSKDDDSDKINEEQLKKIKGEEKVYEKKEEGEPELLKGCQAPNKLVIKKGAQVIMLKDKYKNHGIYNGSVGVVTDFNDRNYPVVKFNNGVEKAIEPDEWNINEYNHKTKEVERKALAKQIPLCLGWSATVKKTQGMVIDSIQCDLENDLTEDEARAILSRVRSLDGLFLKNFKDSAITPPNKDVLKFEKIVGIQQPPALKEEKKEKHGAFFALASFAFISIIIGFGVLFFLFKESLFESNSDFIFESVSTKSAYQVGEKFDGTFKIYNPNKKRMPLKIKLEISKQGGEKQVFEKILPIDVGWNSYKFEPVYGEKVGVYDEKSIGNWNLKASLFEPDGEWKSEEKSLEWRVNASRK